MSLLSLSPSSLGGLILSWLPPAGHWESYRLFLFNGSQQLVSVALHRDALNFTFPGTELVPGRLYSAKLRVESGGLTAESSCERSTGETTAQICIPAQILVGALTCEASHLLTQNPITFLQLLRRCRTSTYVTQTRLRSVPCGATPPPGHVTATSWLFVMVSPSAQLKLTFSSNLCEIVIAS